jgi:hypothetical protein
MTKEFLLTLVLAFFVLLVALMAVGWYTRRRRQRNIPSLLPVPVETGDVLAQFSGLYVSTTPDGEPLNRVAVRGLGFRARASITVAESGVIVSLPANDFFIPVSALREATRARYTIDRVVEAGGLALIAWTLEGEAGNSVDLDSYFRVDETQQLVDAVSGLIPERIAPDEREKA